MCMFFFGGFRFFFKYKDTCQTEFPFMTLTEKYKDYLKKELIIHVLFYIKF